MTKRLKKLLRTLIIIALVTVWVYAFNMYSTFERTESPEKFVQRVHDFYIDSWYDRKSLYQQDIELLQEYKQIAVDNLSYKQTLDYIAIKNGKKLGMIDNDWLNLIDETLKLADEWMNRIPVEEYLSIDSKTTIVEPTAQDLLNEGLEIGMTEAKKSPVKKILK